MLEPKKKAVSQLPLRSEQRLNGTSLPDIDEYLDRLGRLSNIRNPMSNFEPTRGSERAYGIIKGFGVCTNQGLVRDYNEDRVSIVLNILRPQNYPKSDYWPHCCFFGIYDGHGGDNCAEYLRANLHQYVKQPIESSRPNW